jgi:uncharacterized protein YndB with AHSA1/START domain
MYKFIGAGLVLGVAVVLGLAAFQPDTFRVERAITIKAPPEKVFALVNDFHQWAQWSPWERLDPAMHRQHSGPPAGPGAAYAWDGNEKVGKGRMEITSATVPSRVVMQLDFLEPFEAHNTTEFQLEGQGDGTTVTWAMHGPNLFVGKLMSLFTSVDAVVGKDFERGLANLKAVAEK